MSIDGRRPSVVGRGRAGRQKELFIVVDPVEYPARAVGQQFAVPGAADVEAVIGDASLDAFDPSFTDGRAALVLADAAVESLRTGTTVKVGG